MKVNRKVYAIGFIRMKPIAYTFTVLKPVMLLGSPCMCIEVFIIQPDQIYMDVCF